MATTLTQKIEAVGAFAKAAWWWLAIVGLVVGVLLLSRACNRANTAEAALRRANKTAALREAGFVVAVEATQKALEAQAAEITVLRPEIARLRKAAPGVKIKYVTKFVTAPAPAEGVPRPPEAPGAPAPVCLYAWGDTGQLRVGSVGLQTKEGVQVVTMAGSCWRTKPEPETRILSGTATATLSTATVEPAPLKSSPGWGGGGGIGYGTSGAVASVLFSPPPVFDQHVEAFLIGSAASRDARLDVAGHFALVYRP